MAAASVQIRSFRECDADSAREIFTLGMSEHVPSAFVHLLKQPLPQLVVMVTFCALLTSSRSLLLPVLAVTLLLAAARHAVGRMFSRYIAASMSDVAHVALVYLQGRDSHFWVAEVDGGVVGTVGCLPAQHAPGCLELKRLSVRRDHRGRGVAKALCRAVSGFASERGYDAVVLFTSVVQTDAQRLYEHVGYRKVREFAAPELIAKITNFMLFEYRLDLGSEGVSE